MGNDSCAEIICNGEKLVLSSLKAAYWPPEKTLIIADLHLGKSAYFRNKGIAIPSTVMINDLYRLSKLIENFEANEIIVVGDMFHHNFNSDVLLFEEWRQQYQTIKIRLVPGNHDKLLQIDYEKLNISITKEKYVCGPLSFEHEPKQVFSKEFVISGHVHPGYLMQGKARQAMRLPCFIQSETLLVLPAFSEFTGLFTNHELSGAKNYFVVGGNDIFCF